MNFSVEFNTYESVVLEMEHNIRILDPMPGHFPIVNENNDFLLEINRKSQWNDFSVHVPFFHHKQESKFSAIEEFMQNERRSALKKE